MKTADYFLRKFREDRQLNSSLLSYLEEYRSSITAEMVALDEPRDIYRKQGFVQGLTRLMAHLKKQGGEA